MIAVFQRGLVNALRGGTPMGTQTGNRPFISMLPRVNNKRVGFTGRISEKEFKGPDGIEVN